MNPTIEDQSRRYNDMTKGSCGCGSEPNPPDFWTKSKFTAAGNAMMVRRVAKLYQIIILRPN